MVEISCPYSSYGFSFRVKIQMCLKSDEKNYIISRFVRPTRPQNRFQIEILSCIGETQSFRPIGLLRFADVCYSKCTHALTENFVVYLGQDDEWKFRQKKKTFGFGNLS